MSTVRLLNRDNPREGCLRMSTNTKRKMHRAIWEETVYNINIAARETLAEPRCGVKMEVGQHQVLRTTIRTGPTSTKRDLVLLAIHLAMGRYAGNKRNLFIVSTNTTEIRNDIIKGRILVNVTEDLIPFAKGKRDKG